MPDKKSPKFGNVAQSAVIFVVNAVLAFVAFVATGYNFGNLYTWIFVGGAAFGVILNVIQYLAGGPFKGTHIGFILADFVRVVNELVDVIRQGLPIMIEFIRLQKANPVLSAAVSLTQTALQEFDAAPAIIGQGSNSPMAAMVTTAVASIATAINDDAHAPIPDPVATVAPIAMPEERAKRDAQRDIDRAEEDASIAARVLATAPGDATVVPTATPIITIGPSPIFTTYPTPAVVELSAVEAGQLAALLGKLTSVVATTAQN